MTELWILENENGKQNKFNSRAAAEQKQEELARYEIATELKRASTDGGAAVDSDEISDDELEIDEDIADAVNTANEISRAREQDTQEQEQQNEQASATVGGNDLPDSTAVTEDPISWMPEHFVDVIEGVPAINRKGYAVLAEHYGISTIAEPVTYPSESDWEFAEFRAIATTPEGDEYSGFGSAHVERGDEKVHLGELAETRAIKRATANATGVGMTAVSEMKGTQEVVE